MAKDSQPMKLMKGCFCTMVEAEVDYPQRWSSLDNNGGVELSKDGLRARYTGSGKSDPEASSVRADRPIPKTGVALFYFEAKIVKEGDLRYIGVGLCQKGVTLNRLPGWYPGSLGYHTADGKRFRSRTEGRAEGEDYGPKCYTGDVVGVGWNLMDHTVFFTKNGESIGTAFRDVVGVYYPSLGLQSPGGVVETNFGDEPFVFDIEKYAQSEKQRVLSSIVAVPVPGSFETISEVVLNYLLHNGYIETARAYAADVGKLDRLEGELVFAARRQEICALVRRGDINQAISELEKDFSGMLCDAFSKIVFELKCQQLVEMSRTEPIEERLRFAREHLYMYQDMGKEFADGLRDIIVLVAYPDPTQSPFAELLEPARRERVGTELNCAMKAFQGSARKSALERLIAHCQQSLGELRESSNGEVAIVSVEDAIGC